MNTISLYELSYYLKVKPSHLIDFIKNENMIELLNSQKLLLTDAKLLVNTYRMKKNIPTQLWEIPNWLASNNVSWMNVLSNMYMEATSFPASLSPSQGKQVHDIILDICPELVVEIGCFIGISSIWIAAALKESRQDGHLHSIDLFKPKMPNRFSCNIVTDPLNFSKNSAHKAQLSKYITFYKMSSSEFAKNITINIEKPIDFLFIDGDHSIGGCIDDFISFYPYIKEGGYILLHDIYPEACGWDGPRYLVDYLKDSDYFDIKEIKTSPNYGMALIKKIKNNYKFYPSKSIKIEMIRKFYHLKCILGYSLFYQEILKPRLVSILAYLNR